jgi:plastocyanin
MRKLVGFVVLLLMSLVFASACGGTSASGGAGGGTVVVVHMNAANFVQASVTLQKGDTLKLVNDASVTHIIQNGAWQGSTPKTMQESGAPTVNNLTIAGSQSATIGPFTVAGTFHYYCTVHQGMNLTVNVQ